MRLFITSYQKSGTHQIMPIFSDPIDDIVDRSFNEVLDIPDYYGLAKDLNVDGIEETANKLKAFPLKSFGHLSYLPEYAEALQFVPTKVLFNVRDPRDIVVSEYENGLRHIKIGKRGKPLWDFVDTRDGKSVFEKDDPISELIVLASARWLRWIGWIEHDFVLPIRYRDLRLNPFETLSKIQEWLLPFECPPMNVMMKKVLPAPANPTFRKGVPGEWKTTFSDSHKKLAEDLLGDIIIRLGYEI